MTAEPSLHDIPLTQLAAVEAALAEGFDLNEILEIEGIEATRWPAAEAAWKARLAEAPGSAEGEDLFNAYKARLAEAEDRLGRRISPIDDDLQAWASFLKVWSSHPSPFELCSKLGIRMNDISRLSRRWATKLDADRSLRSKAADIAERARPAIPALRVEPAILKPSPAARQRAPEKAAAPPDPFDPSPLLHAIDSFRFTTPLVALPEGPALPFVRPDPDGPPRLPPIAPRRPPVQPTGTSPMANLPRGPALPFPGADPQPPLHTPDDDLRATAPIAAISAAPVLPFGAPSITIGLDGAPGSSPPLTLEQHASLTLELVLFPARRDEVLRRYRVSSEDIETLNNEYKRRFAADPALYVKWRHTYQAYHAWLVAAARRGA